MRTSIVRCFGWKSFSALVLNSVFLCCLKQAAAAPTGAPPQDPSVTQQQTQPAAAAQPPATAATRADSPILAQNASSIPPASEPGITEDEIKQLLVGKTLYLRGGYMENALSFDEHGYLIGHSQIGSYTLNEVQISKVRLSKRKVELVGDRYGLHFLGARASDDPTKAVDRVRITPRKKVLKISIERELVEKPKKKKKKDQANTPALAETASASPAKLGSQPTADTQKAAADSTAAAAPSAQDGEHHVTTTESPEHARRVLRDALDRIFSVGIDDRMIAVMPDFWKLYYQAAATKTDYKPTDPGIFAQSAVDKKATLLSKVEPPSNEFAQTSGVAGLALYHAVIGPDGKAQGVVAGRPIGFGLDESAVETILKASFEPAIKEGKPVTVWLDLVVQFRIYSRRTLGTGAPASQDASASLPGPYSVPGQPESTK